MKKFYVFDRSFYTESEVSNINSVEELEEIVAEDVDTACTYDEEEYKDYTMNSDENPFSECFVFCVENGVVTRLH